MGHIVGTSNKILKTEFLNLIYVPFFLEKVLKAICSHKPNRVS